MQVQALSDRGRRRHNNEDVALAEALPGGQFLLAVADGVGGSRAGEVASSEAVRVLRERVRRAESADPHATLREAVGMANARLRQLGAERPDYDGMSTTLVVALVRERTARIANVGDSRAYLIRDGRAQQVTEDHSLVAERIRGGSLAPEDPVAQFGRHVITRSVGSHESVLVDTFGPIVLEAGAALLLCSDGLHGELGDDEIGAAFGTSRPEIAARLIELANDAGGRDNVSVAVLRAD